MKTRHLVTFLAVSAALPLAGWSQSSTSGSSSGSSRSDSSGGSTWNDNNTNNSNPNAPGTSSSGSDRLNSTNSGTYTPSASGSANGASSYNTDTGYTGSSTADIRRVSQDRLDSRLTAKSLIGQKVVDQSGKEIGRVKDIGLSGVLPQDLQKSSSASSSGMGSSSSSSGSDLSSTGSMSSGMTSAGLSSSRNVPVYVSVGGFLGAGGELVSIPASQLSRDGDNLKVQMSESQIKSLTSNESNSRSGSSSSNSDTSSTSSH